MKIVTESTSNLKYDFDFFSPEKVDENIEKRFAEMDIHACGVLQGKGETLNHEAGLIWSEVLADEAEITQGLEKAGLKSSFRALRLSVKALNWHWHNNNQCKNYAKRCAVMRADGNQHQLTLNIQFFGGLHRVQKLVSFHGFGC